MARKRTSSYISSRAAAPQLVKILERVCTISGHRPHQVFTDWVRLCESTLTEMPHHVARQRREGRLRNPDEDGAETQALMQELERRYHKRWSDCKAIFAEAFAVLMLVARDGIHDILGEMFHEWELHNHWKGQFFTPFELGLLMAQFNNPTQLIHERLKAALSHPENTVGQALLLAGTALEGAEAERYFVERLIPAALPFYDPVTVCDPAVGSGCLLLAMASIVPAWANWYGLVQFYGQDIDALCVAMCRVQCMVFGLNGYEMRLVVVGLEADDQVTLDELLEGDDQAAVLPVVLEQRMALDELVSVGAE